MPFSGRMTELLDALLASRVGLNPERDELHKHA
jgi:hypothetical protein